MRTPAALLIALLAATPAWSGEGLRLPQAQEAQWQARVQLLSSDELTGSRVVAVNFLGDYPLGRGLRLSGGLMVGPQALLGSGAGLAMGEPGAPISLGQRRLGAVGQDDWQRQPYLGLGYSSHGASWRFSADLGVAVRGSGAGLSLRNPDAQPGLDSLRSLQFSPVLQLGLSYRF